MAFKLRGTGENSTKIYLQCVADAAAPGSRIYEYVTDDALATVDGVGYMDNSSDDGKIALDMLKIGDLLNVFQVVALDDSRPISEDKANGISDYGQFIVMENDGAQIDLSNELHGGSTVAYGD